MWVLMYEIHGGMKVYWNGKKWVQSFVLAKKFKNRDAAEEVADRYPDQIQVIDYATAYDLFR